MDLRPELSTRRSAAVHPAVPVRGDDDHTLAEVFVGVLSHELRTPITAIYGGSQLLLRDQMSPEARDSVIRDIAAEAERLHHLVEDLLAIARLERGVSRPGTEPVQIERVARRAGKSEERRWPDRRVVIQSEPNLPIVRGDEGFTTQILRNLLSNAVRVSPPDEPVVVSLRTLPGARDVAVSVLDRGPGFPPAIGSDAFRLFYRSPAVAAKVPGTGIGLYVARTLVESQGGQIWLRNREHGGAEVGFTLPVADGDDTDRGDDT